MKKRLFAIFFLVLMAVLGGASVLGYLKARILSSIRPDNEVAVYSFIKDYPFSDDEDNPKPKLENGRMSVPEWVAARTELFTNKGNPISPFFRGLLHLFEAHNESVIFWAEGSPIIRLPNGYLTYLYPYSQPVDSRNKLLDFITYLRQHNIKYLSLIAADKGDDDCAVFPEGIPHGYSRMAKEYREFNSDYGIEFLESKESLLAHNSNFYYWFYKTDHHWNAHAGLQIAQETAKRLQAMGIEADSSAADKEMFSPVCYPKSFLGSMGRKLRNKYNEDMEVYYPVGNSRFHVKIPSLGIDRIDSFENTLIDSRELSDSHSSYYAFLYCFQPLIRIENLLSTNTTRVLVIKQSKADVLCPYLAFTVRYLDMIDPRSFDGSIRSFIDQTKPDIVITCNDVMYEGDEKFWNLK